MERELWLELYQWLRRMAPGQWWELVVFFRLRDRRSVSVGGLA